MGTSNAWGNAKLVGKNICTLCLGLLPILQGLVSLGCVYFILMFVFFRR